MNSAYINPSFEHSLEYYQNNKFLASKQRLSTNYGGETNKPC